MKNDLTRLLSASVYLDDLFRTKILALAKDRYHAIAESLGLDSKLILEHAIIAEKKNRQIYYVLFIPAILLFFVIMSVLNSYDNETPVAIALVLLTVSCILVCYFDAGNRKYLLKNFTKGNFTTSSNLDNPLLNSIQEKTSENVVCYSGFSPFVGRGVEAGAWSFVVDIDRGIKSFDKTLKPEKFEVEELYEIISKNILSLNIPNLTIEDKILVNGKKIRNDRFFLPKINKYPINKISDVDFEMVSKNENTDIRRYKLIEVTAWEGDLVFSNFIRFQKNDTSLFIESNSFLLPPIADTFREIENLRNLSGFRETLFWIIGNVLKTFFMLPFSIFKVFSYFQSSLSDSLGFEKAEIEKQVIRSNNYNYGAETSIRESVAQKYYLQHFQKLDKEMHQKTIEKRIFNCLGDFLESKGIDTSDFKDRETSILNSGVIVTGGNLNTNNMTVGKKSKISFSEKKE